MKKITGFLSIVFAFIFMIVLASCSDNSGVEVEKSVTASTTTITFNLTFAENANLSGKTAVPHIKLYAYDETKENHVGEYLSQDKTCTFSNNVYTSSTVTFTSLTKDTTYTFRFYVTYNQNEELVATWEEKTSSDNAKEIKTVDDFLAMKDDREGDYTLEADIDFAGAKITGLFTSSGTAFKGTFDGKNHTISNFVFDNANTYGIFTYAEEATIKNLNVVGTTDDYLAHSLDQDGNSVALVNGDYSEGCKTANIGILVGTATKVEFENVTINNVKVTVKGQSNASLNVGGVVGSAANCSFTNVKAEGVDISFPKQLRLNVCVGLFAGSISGEALETEKGAYTAKNTSAKGSITGVLYFPSGDGYVVVGGYAGDLGSSGLVSDSYVVADIKLYRETTTTSTNKFSLTVGGFAGENKNGSMNVKGCLAAADILVKAGVESATNEDAATSKLNTKMTYIGGFVGAVNKYIDSVSDSVYVKKTDGIKVYALASETDDENNTKTLYVANNVCGLTYNASKLSNVLCANDDTFDKTLLASSVAEVLATYLA